jgi:SsrA-binding protein
MAKPGKNKSSLPVLTNSKARHKFALGDRYEAGIVLCNAHIAEYEFGGEENHSPQQPRKLLLKRRELDRLKNEIEAAGKTIVPTRLYFKGSLIKCELAVGTGKNHRDKRQDLKKRDAQRETDQAMKNAMKR